LQSSRQPSKPGETEKITINVGFVDLGHIDLLAHDGFYSNRTDFIRTAIRNQLATHVDAVKQSIGVLTLSRANAAALLTILERRVEMLQRAENHDGPEALAEATQEKDAIVTVLVALEAAVNIHRDGGIHAMKPILELLSQKPRNCLLSRPRKKRRAARWRKRPKVLPRRMLPLWHHSQVTGRSSHLRRSASEADVEAAEVVTFTHVGA
jgi:Arc/MetJ-type ribon-helix-helix transcriptional regulator